MPGATATRLDLFADIDRSAEAIGDFAGAAEARGYRGFCAEARRIYEHARTARSSAPRGPASLGLVAAPACAGLAICWRIRPFATLWGALGDYFHDPRLRQLFGRYATYCGSSPFQAPATLMLVAHVEQEGVWLVEGGMHRLAEALAELAQRRSAPRFRYGARGRARSCVERRHGRRRRAGRRRAASRPTRSWSTPMSRRVAGGLLGRAVAARRAGRAARPRGRCRR